MGTDIHSFVEKKNKQGIWEVIKGPNPAIERHRMYAKWARERGDEAKAIQEEELAEIILNGEKAKEHAGDSFYGEYYSPFVTEGWIYDNRNYSVFAILADVRNYRGTGFVPISEPKGLPEDISEYLNDRCDDYGGHSTSWLTVRELIEYDWKQVTTREGVVSVNEYKIFKATGKPTSWSGSVGGGRTVNITNEQMDLIAAGIGVNPELSYYTLVHWDEPYNDCASDFLDWSLPKLVELANGDPDSVRMVFWFDS